MLQIVRKKMEAEVKYVYTLPLYIVGNTQLADNER